MNPLFLKSVGGIAALSAAAAAGVGISHAYSGSSSGDEVPKPASAPNVKKVGENLTSTDKRWLDLGKDDVEWGFKVDKYKGKDDLKAYGFELKDSVDGKSESVVKENIKGMQSACQKILDSVFEDDLFNKAKEWCSVDKKIVWVEEKTDKKLLGDSEEDKKEWEKKLSDFRKELEKNKKDFEVSDIQASGGDEDSIKKLKERCHIIGDLKIGSGKSQLFRKWCMVKKVSKGS